MANLSTFKEAHLDVDVLTDDTDAATEEALQQVEDVVTVIQNGLETVKT